MLKPQVRELIRGAFFVVCGFVLCAFILIPVLSRLFLDVIFGASLSNSSGPAYLFGSAVFMAAAFSVSSFLMGLFIAFFSRNKEVKPALFAAVIVAVYYSITISSVLLKASNFPPRLLKWRVLELTLDMIFLIVFSLLGAGLVKLIRRGKMQGDKSDVSEN